MVVLIDLGIMPDFTPNDKVLLFKPPCLTKSKKQGKMLRKVKQPWVTGYTMVSKDGPLTYLLIYHPSGQLMHNIHITCIMLKKELPNLPTSHLLHIDVPPVPDEL